MSKLHGMHYTTCDKSYDNLLSLNNNDASGHRKHMQFLAEKLYKSFESLNPISRDDSLLFHDGEHYHIETSPLICFVNQWTGFYMITTSVMKELILILFNTS